LPPDQILLVLKTAVYRQQNIKSGGFSGGEKFAVLESCASSKLGAHVKSTTYK
jgi:hypothetical protein